MSTNPVVNPYRNVTEQRLLDDLNAEAIEHRGLDVYYMPQVPEELDRVTMEDPRASYLEAIEIPVYVRSFEGFQGDGHFMDKFGVNVKDQVLLTVSASTFLREVGNGRDITRPREGDLIFLPFGNRLFYIVFVDKYTNFFPLGALQVYDLRAEAFEYHGQTISTGIEAIDSIVPDLTQDVFERVHATQAGEPIRLWSNGAYWALDDYTQDMSDPLDDRDEVQDEATDILDFTELDPYSEGEF